MSQSRTVRWAALPPRRSLLAFAGGALAAGLPGCSLPTRLAAVPRGRADEATVLGLPNERFFPTEAAGQAGLQREFVAAAQRHLVSRGLPPTAPLPELDLLGISGGGENGAFGAGLLNGWTERGGRPTFFLVTGISTGALSAPFAFLGSARDAKLKSVYTDITLGDVIVQRGYTAAIWNDAMADNSPLFRTISRYVNEAMLAEIGRAYDGGRLLLIATSDLDAQMPVVWNIGAIARIGHPDPEWASVERRTLGITGRAITSMISASGFNDVLRIHAAAERDGVDYKLAFSGRDFTVEYDKPFEQSYMRPLFEHGRQRALRGDAWVKRPPI